MHDHVGSRNGRPTSWRRALLKPYRFAVLGLVIAFVLVVIAKAIFDGSRPDTFRREFANLSLQLALIVVLGALVKLLIDSYTERRTRIEQDHAKRIELLRRMRAQHVKIAYAQRLILAHMSGKTYTEQLRNLMLVTPELEDISEDIRAAGGLFGRDGKEIITGIEDIVCYLDEGADEYVRCHGFVDADPKAGEDLKMTIQERNMTWVDQFIKSSPDFPERYGKALAMSKGNLRKHVYSE
jgi:hypothetical protein